MCILISVLLFSKAKLDLVINYSLLNLIFSATLLLFPFNFAFRAEKKSEIYALNKEKRIATEYSCNSRICSTSA